MEWLRILGFAVGQGNVETFCAKVGAVKTLLIWAVGVLLWGGLTYPCFLKAGLRIIRDLAKDNAVAAAPGKQK